MPQSFQPHWESRGLVALSLVQLAQQESTVKYRILGSSMIVRVCFLFKCPYLAERGITVSAMKILLSQPEHLAFNAAPTTSGGGEPGAQKLSSVRPHLTDASHACTRACSLQKPLHCFLWGDLGLLLGDA